MSRRNVLQERKFRWKHICSEKLHAFLSNKFNVHVVLQKIERGECLIAGVQLNAHRCWFGGTKIEAMVPRELEIWRYCEELWQKSFPLLPCHTVWSYNGVRNWALLHNFVHFYRAVHIGSSIETLHHPESPIAAIFCMASYHKEQLDVSLQFGNDAPE